MLAQSTCASHGGASGPALPPPSLFWKPAHPHSSAAAVTPPAPPSLLFQKPSILAAVTPSAQPVSPSVIPSVSQSVYQSVSESPSSTPLSASGSPGGLPQGGGQTAHAWGRHGKVWGKGGGGRKRVREHSLHTTLHRSDVAMPSNGLLLCCASTARFRWSGTAAVGCAKRPPHHTWPRRCHVSGCALPAL